jgi:GPH family glycoside/pentoside/hexuronide:cation symporter
MSMQITPDKRAPAELSLATAATATTATNAAGPVLAGADASPAPAPVPESERLSLRTQIAFSAQGFAGAAMGLLVAVYLGKFYVDVVLLPAGLFAVAVAAGRALDAITDPFMGYVSDHTRSRWGRRKPWILAGLLGNAVVFYAMLTPSASLTTSQVMAYFVGCYGLSFAFVTMINVPRTALGAELTLETRQRANLYGVAALFVGLGTIVGAMLPVLIGGAPPGSGALGQKIFLGLSNDPRYQMQLQATWFVVAYLVLNLWFLWVIKERPEFMGRGETPFVPGVRRALRNQPFRIMFISHVITAIPIAMPATLMPFFVQYVLKISPIWTAALIVVYLASGVLCLPLWVKLARRFGKLAVWLAVSAIGVTGGAALFFVGPGDEWLLLAIEAYVGAQSQVWLFLGAAMHADVIDYDELHSGKRREAQFSALWAIIPKFALIPGAAIPLAVLGGVGYVPNQEQSPEVLLTMRLLFAVVPALFNAIGLSIMWWYPLSEKKHAAVRAGIAAHAAGKDAIDPITGKRLAPPNARNVDEATGWYLDYFSSRELRSYAARGVQPLGSAIFWTVLCAVVTVVATYSCVASVKSLDVDPGPLPSLNIVLAGMSLTAFLFHALRIRPALQLRRKPLDAGTVRQHIDEI